MIYRRPPIRPRQRRTVPNTIELSFRLTACRRIQTPASPPSHDPSWSFVFYERHPDRAPSTVALPIMRCGKTHYRYCTLGGCESRHAFLNAARDFSTKRFASPSHTVGELQSANLTAKSPSWYSCPLSDLLYALMVRWPTRASLARMVGCHWTTCSCAIVLDKQLQSHSTIWPTHQCVRLCPLKVVAPVERVKPCLQEKLGPVTIPKHKAAG